MQPFWFRHADLVLRVGQDASFLPDVSAARQNPRELAAETGETLTEAVVIALRDRLDREHAKHVASIRTRLAHLAADVAALPVADDRTPEEIIGYDGSGLPR
jgi:antitoxin VapB